MKKGKKIQFLSSFSFISMLIKILKGWAVMTVAGGFTLWIAKRQISIRRRKEMQQDQ
jgi:hypothetical protein